MYNSNDTTRQSTTNNHRLDELVRTFLFAVPAAQSSVEHVFRAKIAITIEFRIAAVAGPLSQFLDG